jgi:hypothetical protein
MKAVIDLDAALQTRNSAAEAYAAAQANYDAAYLEALEAACVACEALKASAVARDAHSSALDANAAACRDAKSNAIQTLSNFRNPLEGYVTVAARAASAAARRAKEACDDLARREAVRDAARDTLDNSRTAKVAANAAWEAALAAATFDQAFAELVQAIQSSPNRRAAVEATEPTELVIALEFALDKLPSLDPYDATNLLQRSAALAALAARSAFELEGVTESLSAADEPEIDLSLAVLARAELRSALRRLNDLADRGEALMHPNSDEA